MNNSRHDPDWYFIIETLEQSGCVIVSAEINAFLNKPFSVIRFLTAEERRIALDQILTRWQHILAGWQDTGVHIFVLPPVYLYDPLKDPEGDRPIIRCTIVDATIGNGLKVPMFHPIKFEDASPEEEFYDLNSLIPIGPYSMEDQGGNAIENTWGYYADIRDAIADAGAAVYDGRAEEVYIQNSFGNTIESMNKEDAE